MECLLASWYTHLTPDSYTVTFCFVFRTQLQHFITKTNRIASQQTNAISNTNSSSVKLLHKHFSLCLSTKQFISLLLFPNFMRFVPHTLLLICCFTLEIGKPFFIRLLVTCSSTTHRKVPLKNGGFHKDRSEYHWSSYLSSFRSSKLSVVIPADSFCPCLSAVII